MSQYTRYELKSPKEGTMIDALIKKVIGENLPLQTRIEDYYIQHGMKWEEANLIGIRAAKDFYTNKFLDLLCIVTDKEVLALRATTVPGPNWTPENCKKFGVTYTAVVCLGYHESTFGFANHRDHPPGQALRARTKLACFRDLDRDSKMGSKEGPYFEPPNSGMDIHALSASHAQSGAVSTEKVNFASAGCQVAQSRTLFLSRFMPMLYATKEAKKGAAARFSYFLTTDAMPFYKELKSLAQ